MGWNEIHQLFLLVLTRNNFLFLEKFPYYDFILFIELVWVFFVLFFFLFLLPPFLDINAILFCFWPLIGNSLFHGYPMFCLLQTCVCEVQPYFYFFII